MITSYGYGTLHLKTGPNLPGPIFPTPHIFPYIFLFNLILPSGSPLHTPPIFLHSRLPSRLQLVTHVRDSIRDYHLRLTFATPLMTPIRDSRSRNYTAEGRTVLTPQRHLPSVPTLTQKNFGTYSQAWPPPLATTHHHVHHPQWPCVPVMPFVSPPPPAASTPPPCQAPCQHPHIYHTL